MRKFTSVYLQALVYIAAGINHFYHPAIYVEIMPDYLSQADFLVALSGLAEIALGMGLLLPKTRVWSSWGLIALLVAVFPANIQMAQDFAAENSPYLWVAIARLPLQLLLIWWAYDAVKWGRKAKV